jgi:hypothetical protein
LSLTATPLFVNQGLSNERFCCLEYYDVALKATFFKEQEAKDKLDDDNKKAALSKGL